MNTIERIKEELELMEYKDHWTHADWAKRAQLLAELNKLQTNGTSLS